MVKHLLILLLLLIPVISFSQQYNLVLDNYRYDMIDKAMQQKGSGLHTTVKPYRMEDVLKVINPDTAAGVTYRTTTTRPGKKLFHETLVGRKVLKDNLLSLDSSDFQVYLDPLFSFDTGKDQLSGVTTYTNSRGLQVFGNIGKKVSFYTSFWENQGRFVNYVDSFIQVNHVVPGQGRVKELKDGKGYDYAYATGYISYSPSRYFNFQFGNDKNFIGDGYRSLFLSDNAFNNPYFKISTTFWKIRYTNLFTSYQNIGNASNSGIGGYLQKFTSYHHLSINATKWLNIGLFEAIVWQGGDSTGRRGFDVNYLNPVIFYRPVEFSRGSPDNVLIGVNFKAIFFKKNQAYGQLLLDEFSLGEVRAGNGWWGNKQGFQLGFKFFDIFGIKNLNYQNELNYVRPYTYGHFTGEQSYTHYAQPLAHPLGANFIENVQFLRWRRGRIGVEGKFLLAQYGADTLMQNGLMTNYGQNIFTGTAEIGQGPTMVPSIYGNKTLQGLKNTVTFMDLNLSYLINTRTNMRVQLTFSRRMQENALISKNTNWVFLSFRTALPNRYYDF